MSPALLLTVLVAALIALIPVWRLRVAGWPPRSLLTAWILYTVGLFVAVRFPGAARVLVPILVLAVLAPFVAGPERLTRMLQGRRTTPGVIIDVTPRPAPPLPEPPSSPDTGPANAGSNGERPEAGADGERPGGGADGERPGADPDRDRETLA